MRGEALPRAPFAFDGQEVRIDYDQDGEPWFCARDLGACLRMSQQTVSDATGRLPANDVVKGTVATGTPGGRQAMVYVSESGLYAFIMQSRKPEAVRFQRWVTSEVLPAIRKTGRYEIAPQSLEERSLGLITELAGVVEKQKLLIASQAETLEAQRPAVIWAAEQEKSSGSWTTAEVVGESDTSLLLGPRLWEALDAVFFFCPEGGQRRFQRSFVVDGTGVNLIRTSGNYLERITPRWTARGVGRLKAWLRDQERQGRLVP